MNSAPGNVVAEKVLEPFLRLGGGCQVHVSIGGAIVAGLATGHASSHEAMRGDHPIALACAARPFLAVGLALLWERGLLDLIDPVRSYFPGFVEDVPNRTTLWHLLTHTAGLVPHRYEIDPDMSWTANGRDLVKAIIGRGAEPGWVPGRRARNDDFPAWMLLGSVIQQVSGIEFERFIEENVFQPCGMSHTHYRNADTMLEGGQRPALGAAPYDSDVRYLAFSEIDPWVTLPTLNAYGTAEDLGLFYSALLSPSQLRLSPVTISALTAHQRVRLVDELYGDYSSFGLGFHKDLIRRLDPRASIRSFGHGGWLTAIGWADPESGLAAALTCTSVVDDGGRVPRVFADCVYDLVFGADASRDVPSVVRGRPIARQARLLADLRSWRRRNEGQGASGSPASTPDSGLP